MSGSASITTDGIQVTKNERIGDLTGSLGRAIYREPLHLWDNASSKLADFSTHFTFVIYSEGNQTYADGLTFFLAPVDSVILPLSGGGGLGVGKQNQTANSSSEAFVAVEFDTYHNPWDPFDDQHPTHVGIDVNSTISVAVKEWYTNISGGVQNEAWITYNADSRNLSVKFTNNISSEGQQNSISYPINLREYLPEYVVFGFSATTGVFYQTNNVKSWEFNATNLDPDVASTPAAQLPPRMSPVPVSVTDHPKGNKTGLIVGLSVGLPLLILATAFAGCCCWKKRHQKESEEVEIAEMNDEFEKGTGPKKFTYNELFRATSRFAEEEKLGEGGFGGVYRGWLRETGSYVAVKRVSQGSKQGLKEYVSEVKIISQLRHRNLVQLVGWCHEKGELLLVYDFMQNGSLDFHLFKGKSILTWEVRFKIALGLASALLYLHEEWERCVVHRDIKTSNIMLDSSFNTKLGDFGLARFIDHEKGAQTTIVAGTMGYMAPECVVTGRASKETDMYSFGIVLLEIASGRRTFDHRFQQEQTTLAEWVWSLYGLGKLVDAADPKLGAEFEQQEIECLMIVGLWCVHPDPNHRPSISQAIQVLKYETELPVLSTVMPVPGYYAPKSMSVNGSFSTVGSGSVVTDSDVYTHYSHSSNVTSSSSGSATALLRT